jgi:exopolyphosphatase / guanosine-5'-triphosphate,3'-diphosphate pyrophosphatase
VDTTPDVLGAVDIGTNSLHLVIARVSALPDGGRLEILTREKESVRLGSGQGDMKHLAPDAMDRAMATLERFRRIAEAHDAPLVAVATSAVREAENRGEFVRRAAEEAGVRVRVVSGVEEARLIHLGVLQAVPFYDRRMLLVDIGGGSTELLIGERDEALGARSLKLGAIRMTDRFFPGRVSHPGAVDACRTHARATLEPARRELAAIGFDVAVGSSGTIGTLAAMVATDRDGSEPRSRDQLVLRRDALDGIVADLTKAARKGRRPEHPALETARADIILGGALILEQVMEAFAVEELVFADAALREGVLIDAVERTAAGTIAHLADLRRRSIDHLVALCDEDPDHAEHTARLAVRLFDETAELHGGTGADRELLEAATRLANVGLFISHAQHHKHSYYVIRNSEHLSGFTDREIEVIAQVARYHRKSEPKRKHEEFEALDEEDRTLVRLLAGLARVAIALDRGHDGRVRDLDVVDDGRVLDVGLVARDGVELDLELHTAPQRSGLLARTLGRELSFGRR